MVDWGTRCASWELARGGVSVQTQGSAKDEGDAPAAPVPVDQSRVDVRTLTRVLFERLAELPPGAPERERVRAALIEVNPVSYTHLTLPTIYSV